MKVKSSFVGLGGVMIGVLLILASIIKFVSFPWNSIYCLMWFISVLLAMSANGKEYGAVVVARYVTTILMIVFTPFVIFALVVIGFCSAILSMAGRPKEGSNG